MVESVYSVVQTDSLYKEDYVPSLKGQRGWQNDMQYSVGEMLSPYGGGGKTTNSITGVHWV